MKLLTIFALVTLLVASLIGVWCYRFFGVVNRTVQIQVGPFTVQADATTGKSWNINYGLVESTNVGYSIWFQGKLIESPMELQSNTGLPVLWKVYEVRGTSEPTLIAGSQSLFMVKIRKGQPEVTPLLKQYSDFATIQFLDHQSGQPGSIHTVCMSSSSEQMDQIEVLEGGRLLLVGGLSVLDVESGEMWNFSTQGRSLGNYSFPSPHDAGALAFSPDQNSIVFNAEFQSWNNNLEDYIKYAMVVFDFKADRGYVVPYDDNETRLSNLANVDHPWFTSRFDWIKPEAGQDILHLRHHDQPYPWLGQYKAQDNYYYLYPVQPEMLPAFLDFVVQYLGWTKEAIVKDETNSYQRRTISLRKNGIELDINFQEDEKQITLSKQLYLEVAAGDTTYAELVRRIANAFNQQLSQGEYQQYFGQTLKPNN